MPDNESTLTCAFHPKRETKLRCNRCNRPICVQCAIQTPTGYRCPECVRDQQKVFVTVKWHDYLLAVLITGVLSFLGSLLAVRLGFFTILLAPMAGMGVEIAVRKSISNRRSPLLYKVVGATAFIASLPMIIIQGLSSFSALFNFGWLAVGGLYPFIWVVVYAVTITSTVYYRFTS